MWGRPFIAPFQVPTAKEERTKNAGYLTLFALK